MSTPLASCNEFAVKPVEALLDGLHVRWPKHSMKDGTIIEGWPDHHLGPDGHCLGHYLYFFI
jgi:hypothetical protein